MILAFHGKAVRLDDLRASLGGGREGTTALSLLNVARQFGLRGRGARIEIEDLKYLQREPFSTGISVTSWYSSGSAAAAWTSSIPRADAAR
jgi:hypothetical protein